MSAAVPPGLTRFHFSIQPRDGSRHRHLFCDIEEVVVPAVGSSFGIDVDCGVTLEVHQVNVYPTCDPMVYVRGRSLFLADAREAAEVVREALAHGWKEIGA